MLSPVRAGLVGVDVLNRMLQTRFRTKARELAETEGWGRKVPRPVGPQTLLYGDKVINVINQRRRDVWPKPAGEAYLANGDIGIVVGRYKTKKLKDLPWKLEVEFSGSWATSTGFTPASSETKAVTRSSSCTALRPPLPGSIGRWSPPHPQANRSIHSNLGRRPGLCPASLQNQAGPCPLARTVVVIATGKRWPLDRQDIIRDFEYCDSMSDLLEVQIRPYKLGDALAVWEAARESVTEIQPWMAWCHDEYSVAESREWLAVQVQAFQDGTAFKFAIVERDGQYLGGCGLNQIDATNKRANLGYWVRSSVARRGVATAAVALLQKWAFRHTDLVRLELVIAAGNLASQRVVEKAGAECEGTLRQRLWLYGTAQDARMCAFTRPEPSHVAV